jgi:hypothetical protein
LITWAACPARCSTTAGKHVVIRRDSGQVYFNVELLHFATTAASGSLSTDGF